MTTSVNSGAGVRGLPPWAENVKVRAKSAFDFGVDFVKKGAMRRQTYLRLKELTAERLKHVPNYVVLEAAKKHVRLGLEAVLAISLIANFVFATRLIEASDRLSQKRIALVPSKLDQVTEVDVGKVSEQQLYGTFVMYLGLLGTVDGTNIEENYRILKDFMSPELKIQFERETKDYRRMVKEEGMAEQLKVVSKKIAASKSGKVEAEAVVRVRPSFGATVGKEREEKITMQMRMITNYTHNQWLLEINELTRGPLQGYESQR